MQIGHILLGLIIIILIWILIEQKLLVTTKYTVLSDKLPKAFHNTSFIVLSDLHNFRFGKDNKRLIKKIHELSPEFIIVAGDIINKQEACYPSNAYSLLNRLAVQYKIYYAYGNHEQWMKDLLEQSEQESITSTWVEYKKNLKNSGVIFLDNESILIQKDGSKLRITGVSIDEKYFVHRKMPVMEEGYLKSLIGKKPEEVYELLIAHSPVYFPNYTEWGADLTVSGHTHGGLVRLPGIGGVVSPQVLMFPKYDSGNYTEKGQHMIVSRGLGSHSMMPRMFNAPEIVNVTLKNDSDNYETHKL